jgi:hypothetical protein
MSIRYILAIIVLTILPSVACADFTAAKDEPHRIHPANSSQCAFFRNNPTALLKTRNDELANAIGADIAACSFQYHSGAKPETAFQLAFLEFFENGQLRKGFQFDQLKQHLTKDGPHIVVVYIHGWRHDANVGNSDVKRFRTMLAYTRRAMQVRCKGAGTDAQTDYCNHQLTGVYVGWPGRARWDGDALLDNVSAALPLESRKEISEKISGPVLRKLTVLHELLVSGSANRPANQKSKMLVMGHSLGGNLLATALEAPYKNAIAKHQAGSVMNSVLGDLVVLINPASEASKWVNIQKTFREHIGLKDSKSTFGKDDNTAIKAHRFYTQQQNPIYISLSSACEYPRFVPEKRYGFFRSVPCDKAVADLFPVFNFFNGRSRKYDRTAIGHFEPDGFCGKGVKHCSKRLPRSPQFFGVTHELDINCLSHDKSSCQTVTNYSEAMNSNGDGKADDLSACDLSSGWLTKAKARAVEKGSPHAIKWDGGWTSANSYHPLHSARGLYAQFRHSIYRGLGKFYITPANDPFWNVRAHYSAIKGHGGYGGFPMLCIINQLFLDNPSQK